MAMGGRVRNLQPFQISPDRVEWLAKAEILVANFDEHRPNFEDLSGFNERIHEFASIRNPEHVRVAAHEVREKIHQRREREHQNQVLKLRAKERHFGMEIAMNRR